MEGYFVRGPVVSTFDDVDFAIGRPVLEAGLPDRRPCATALWHVPNVEATMIRRNVSDRSAETRI